MIRDGLEEQAGNQARKGLDSESCRELLRGFKQESNRSGLHCRKSPVAPMWRPSLET